MIKVPEKNLFSSHKMFPCLPYTVSTPFMAPNSIKENEDAINKLNQELLNTARGKQGDCANVKILKISRNQLTKILNKESTGVKIQQKCFLDNTLINYEKDDSNLKNDWNELPQQVKVEVMKLKPQKQFRKCRKNCPCKYTHGLTQLYHNAQLVYKKAEEIEARKGNRKPQMSSSDVDFSKEDDSTCKNLINELRNQKTDMKKLKNICKNVNNKLKFHSEQRIGIEKHLKEVKEKIKEVNEIVEEFHGKISQSKDKQQTIETVSLNNALSLEEEEIIKVKKEIEMRLRRQEEWKEQEKNWDRKICKERQTDILLILKSTNLMENYIQELKSKINL